MFASSYTTSFASILVSFGLLVGFGLGFVYVPAVVALGDYFRERLSYVTGVYLTKVFSGYLTSLGICVCVSGAGMFLIGPLMSSLFGPFGFRGCNRVMALLCLDCAFFGLAMVPNNKKKRQQVKEKDMEEEEDTSGLGVVCEIPFLLFTMANITNAMGIYICYTYLPLVWNYYLPIEFHIIVFPDGWPNKSFYWRCFFLDICGWVV